MQIIVAGLVLSFTTACLQPSLKTETTARSLLRSENAANTNWTQSDSRTFVYDSWNVISETISNQTSTITNSYVWGLDLSGSLSGAGGIGGLLASCSSSTFHPVLFCYDANGNVSEVIGAQTGGIAAHYEYSPFGETIVATGELATENPFRFSTKPAEDNTGLVLYEYRPYSPSMGRWLSRDPIGEKVFYDDYIHRALYSIRLAAEQKVIYASCLQRLLAREKRDIASFFDEHINGCLYRFCGNVPLNGFDVLGLDWFYNAGNYCGGDRCGGKNHKSYCCTCDFSVAADGDMDECCKGHDKCLCDARKDDGKVDDVERKKCNEKMCNCLKNDVDIATFDRLGMEIGYRALCDFACGEPCI